MGFISKVLRRSAAGSGGPERYGPNGNEVVRLVEFLRDLTQGDITLLAGLYGRNHGLIPGVDQADADFDRMMWANITRLPLAAIDRRDRPAPQAVRAAAEGVLAAIDRTNLEPSPEVTEWAPKGGADLGLLLVVRPEAHPFQFSALWNRYADELAGLRQIRGEVPDERESSVRSARQELDAEYDNLLGLADDETATGLDEEELRAADVLAELGAWTPNTSDYFVLTARLSGDGLTAVQITERADWTFGLPGMTIGTPAGERRTWHLDVARSVAGSWQLTEEGSIYNDRADAYDSMDRILAMS